MARGRPRKNPEDVLIRSAELIGWALGGIEREIVETRNRLASLTKQAAQLRTRIGARGAQAGGGGSEPALEEPAAGPANRKRRRRKMSPEARKRISDMMKKRWADKRKTDK